MSIRATFYPIRPENPIPGLFASAGPWFVPRMDRGEALPQAVHPLSGVGRDENRLGLAPFHSTSHGPRQGLVNLGEDHDPPPGFETQV
ncbi:MAG: hypothetical protein ACE5ID_05060, partial [Acidobacteriota bacterium]